jgi:uncharacterized damage-inducible protein DinB
MMTGTISLSVLNELFDYNYWARDRQLQACATLSEAQFLRPLGSSFSSLRDTLAHLVAVEWIWLERWRGRSPRSLLSAEDFPTVAAVSERWHGVESEMRQYLAGLSEDALARSITYVNRQGQTWTYVLWRMMLHVLNHQSYHRGQVTTLLRQLGVQAPEVDFLVAHDVQFR